MKPQEIKEAAELMGVSLGSAFSARMRFLHAEKRNLGRKLWILEKRIAGCGCGPNFLITASDIRRRLREGVLMADWEVINMAIKRLNREIASIEAFFSKKPANKKALDIEGAKQVPIEDVLVAFGHKVSPNGMLKCPFHKDRSESASVKKGVLVCFAGCTPRKSQAKAWDSIALYQELAGCDFPTAVRGVLAL
ncbi:MAG: hypothetical protein RBQ99_01660 [Trichlorobacter sp.]|nr:hypothetical protein [Trichlorobacter sp.]